MLTAENIRIPGLEPISLSLKAGECVAISGESGCGKTRLLRALADMEENEGKVCVQDTCKDDVTGHEWRKIVALLPAESQWWFDTVGQHFSSPEIDFDELGFDKSVQQWQIMRCSSGEKQRLSILRLLENKPRVLLLDEPTANLDAENTKKVEELIAAYLKNNSASAIWVSHNREQLKRVTTDKSYDLSKGRFDVVASA